MIAQLRAELIAERAYALRLTGYVDEVLAAEVPGDEAVPAWESADFRAYWRERAEGSLARCEEWRGPFWRREPIPALGGDEQAGRAA